MAQTPESITAAHEAFALSLKEGRFYDAHEDLEAIWHPRRFEDDDEVRLWKGFINAAVCFELLRRGRPEPSKKAWATYLKYASMIGSVRKDRYLTYVKMAQLVEETYNRIASAAHAEG